MATNPEAVGRLLANSALMQGERQLLRRQGEPAAEAETTAVQQKADPIANDSKAVATVLLTLLDEQLHAIETAPSGRPGTANATDSDVDAPKRVAAKYAADGLVASDDSVLTEPMIANDQARMREMPSMVSADLQTFVQRFTAFAAGRSLFANENASSTRRGTGTASGFFNRASPLRLASVAAVLLWLLTLIVQWMAR